MPGLALTDPAYFSAEGGLIQGMAWTDGVAGRAAPALTGVEDPFVDVTNWDCSACLEIPAPRIPCRKAMATAYRLQARLDLAEPPGG